MFIPTVLLLNKTSVEIDIPNLHPLVTNEPFSLACCKIIVLAEKKAPSVVEAVLTSAWFYLSERFWLQAWGGVENDCGFCMAHDNYISRGSMHCFFFHTLHILSLFESALRRRFQSFSCFPLLSVSNCEPGRYRLCVKHPGKRFVPERGLGLFLWGPMCCLSPTGAWVLSDPGRLIKRDRQLQEKKKQRHVPERESMC